ncbi:PHB depolymerase family esterase [uncultured Sphaerotilus sp.]|uniref:extracellular catalytic domain type 1 short-chain-length polyhydroxyalkanoate depolymerase n=1 Tax=uncultured Sphaerotilus sp. TaxID=474984 RepID=UPI0030CA28EE
MARRPVKLSPLLASTQRLTTAAGKMVQRAVKKAVKQSVRKAVQQIGLNTKAHAPPKTGDWSSGLVFGPAGARRYRFYLPPGLRAGAAVPLLVMLHGCSQDAEGFAALTRMNRLAAKQGFAVLYPEQDRLANPQGCWNWYGTRSHLADAEAATLLLALDQVLRLHPLDAARVAVAGLSAGASMAALLAARAPDRFVAVAMHSGVPPGSADSSLSAMRAMFGRGGTPDEPGAAAAHWPPLLVLHGTMDFVVSSNNGVDAATLWATALGARATAERTVQRGQRRALRITDYRVGRRVVVTLALVTGMGHAWSGGAKSLPFSDPTGPDASALIWAFVRRQFPRQKGRPSAQVRAGTLKRSVRP